MLPARSREEKHMALWEVDDGKAVRLIDARTTAGARSFAAQTSISVQKATLTRIHTLAARGVKIEQATGEPGASAEAIVADALGDSAEGE
jgi:hypothetical protein